VNSSIFASTTKANISQAQKLTTLYGQEKLAQRVIQLIEEQIATGETWMSKVFAEHPCGT